MVSFNPDNELLARQLLVKLHELSNLCRYFRHIDDDDVFVEISDSLVEFMAKYDSYLIKFYGLESDNGVNNE